ncbi:unnamed protein product [Timema podura]|uniref:Uncharacterized protein n=1 Tax=Timema podura TaxID=61482 RepID=A0ABN7NNJ2_TIMPD|nr:unnamed protein product [Timema podura]
MSKNSKSRQLFLLEVLVDKVKIKSWSPVSELGAPSTLSIKVKFLGFPHINIDQDAEGQNEPENLVRGKSCLLPMKPEELLINMQKAPLVVSVSEKNEHSSSLLAHTYVKFNKGMVSMVRSVTEGRDDDYMCLPISQSLRDSFPLLDKKNSKVGEITLFIRLSYFGHSVVTQFKLVGEEKSVLFKKS